MARVLAITLNPALDLSIGLDALLPGEVNRAVSAATQAAGKGNNVARVLAAHGHDVVVSGFLGADNDRVFEAAFTDWGVADAFVRVPGATRTNVKLAEDAGRVTDINTPGAGVGDAEAARLAAVLDKALADRPDAIVLAGSLARGLTPARWQTALAPLARTDVPLWLDASGAALEAGLMLAPTLVKPNQAELAGCVGRALHDEAALIAAADELCERGAGAVAVSRGAAGVVWRTANALWAASAPSVAVTSTVAAGDTLLAGLLHGRLSGWRDPDTLAFAVALSAEAVMHVGVGRSDAPAFAGLHRAVRVTAADTPAVVR